VLPCLAGGGALAEDGVSGEIRRIEPTGLTAAGTNSLAGHACVVAGADVFIGGVRADDPEGDVTAQMRDALATVERLLEAAGANRRSVLWVHIWLADMSLFGAMTAVWNDWVDADAAPLRACVSGQLSVPGALVELMVHARRM